MKRVRLIALDMDGTLLLSDHQTVPQRNIDAIRRADAAGIRVCICTGRMIEDASDFVKRLKLPCMLIACNGTRISDAPLPEGRILYRRSLEPEDAKRAIDLLMPYHIMMNGFEDGRVTTIAFAPGQHYHVAKRALVDVCYGEEAMYAAAERGIMKLYLAEDGCDGAADNANIRAARAAVRAALPADAELDGSTVKAEFTADSGRALAVVLQIHADATYSVASWKATTLWTESGAGETLWSGAAQTR